MRRLAFALSALLLAGCMTYDFEPVTPFAVSQYDDDRTITARALKPNVMLVIDKSGSMESPINPSAATCGGCGPSMPCPASCPTRISELRSAMSTFLSRSGQNARLGMTFFPTDSACGSPVAIDVALPAPTADDAADSAPLVAQAQAIDSRIQAVAPTGGTPTAEALRFVGALPGLRDNGDNRDDLIILLTDGLPNCNEGNPNQVCTCDANTCGSCGAVVCTAQQTACRCTLGTTASACAGQNCARGCLDDEAVVAVTRQNRDARIKTIVVGFGADTTVGDAPLALNAIAEAGAYARTCPMGTDAECGAGNRCLAGGVCEKRFFQATNAAELADILERIVRPTQGCTFVLAEAPSRPEYLSVRIDGSHVDPGPDTWSYSAGAVTFTGALCDRILASTAANPVRVSLRSLNTL